ncbi:MAG: hypothetical protein LBD07_00445 [Spirochaetaceae bacterium]|jgi:hypothetical protein|nr:hypothetical protein [Spirochaetaceae bacterium]
MANQPEKHAIFTIAMTAWLVLALIFAGVFIIVEHHHEHIDAEGHSVPTGENCHICLEIQIAMRIIEAFGRLGVSLFLAGFIIYAVSWVKPQAFFFAKKPIELKVRFNC